MYVRSIIFSLKSLRQEIGKKEVLFVGDGLMKIVFIGDIHYEDSGKTAGVKLNLNESVSDYPLKVMPKLLGDRYKDDKIALLVFLGDYSFGKLHEEVKKRAFEQVISFAEIIERDYPEIFNEPGKIKDRIVFLDGNHDVLRGDNHHDLFDEVFKDYITPFTPKCGENIRKYGAPIFDYNELDILLSCISTTQNAGAYFSNVDRLFPVIESLKDTDPDNYKAAMAAIDDIRNADIGSVTYETIERFKSLSDIERKIKIVVSHHPLIPMQQATAVHFDTINGGFFLETARAKGFSYFVNGHIHEFNCLEIESKGKKSDLSKALLLSVPSLMNHDEQQFVELEIVNDGYTCRHLRVDRIRDRIEEVDVATSLRRTVPYKEQEHMLLDYEIQTLIEDGNIIQNASSERIEAVAYDCSLGLHYKRYDQTQNTWPDKAEKMIPAQDGPATIRLEPNETVLLYTHEEFDIPDNMMLHASPRASLNRKGLDVGLSFFVEPGFCGPFCFPATNRNSHVFELSAQEAIMSVVFYRLSGPVDHGWKDRHPQSKGLRLDKGDI